MRLSLLLTLSLARRCVESFQLARLPSARLPRRQFVFQGEDASEEAPNGSLLRSEDAKSQLFEAFTNLDLTDQYDAVLTGLCAKILDQTELKDEELTKALEDPKQLLQEMNKKRIQASPRSLMALIDSTVKTQDVTSMANIMSICLQNGGLTQYGSRQTDILMFPPTPASPVPGMDKTRKERLATIEVPSDERGIEVTNAVIVGGVAAGCVLANIVGLNDLTPFTNLILAGLIVVGAVDNFYDILKGASKIAVSQVAKEKEFDLPEKDKLPLGLGSGVMTGSVVRGFSRLLTTDPTREALCEGSAVYAAYVLGLPCFAYRANALEASMLVADKSNQLWSSSGILRMLIWLMAPVAAEAAKYPVCICSDPREARNFLERLEEYAVGNGADTFWDPSEREALLAWAYAEADVLLRNERRMAQDISERLEGGASTVADCVAAVERW